MSHKIRIFVVYKDISTACEIFQFNRFKWIILLNHFAKAIPVIFFFGSMINLAYYLGALQYFILKLSWLINVMMGTSPTESINVRKFCSIIIKIGLYNNF